ncbi:hypothetical protein [Clostridium botulinum]|uniref:hypothetical protein n=1 Tax=Clostridium botulinum TaxID=1491 RepID=UPI003DA580CB
MKIFNWLKNNNDQIKKKNTVEFYDLEEFIFDDKIKKTVRKLLKQYRDQFSPNLLRGNHTSDKCMMLAMLPLTEELKNYYNNDLCLSVAISIAIARNTKFNIRTHAFYSENAIFRIANTWEYLSIVLSEYLNTELIVGTDLRSKIIDGKCHNIDFVKHGNGYKPIITRLPEKIIDEIKPKIKRSNKLFDISTKTKNNVFHKTLKKKYVSNENIDAIFDLYYCEDVKEIIELRNEIVHRRSLGAKFSIAPLNFMPAQGIDINPGGWYEFKDLDIKLEKNLSAIRKAIQMLIDIIFSNEVPNLKIYGDMKFYVYKVKCLSCTKDLLINDKTVQLFKESNKMLICPYCNEDKTMVNEKIEVHDRFYFSNIKEYNEFLFNYWKKNNDIDEMEKTSN